MNATEFNRLIGEVTECRIELATIRAFMVKNIEEEAKKSEPKYYREITVKTLDEAVAVLNVLKDTIKKYGVATVRDYYDACDLDSEYSDCKFGWTDLTSAYITKERGDEYWIHMPKTVEISIK